MVTRSGWIGVDLDGTLAHYDGWQGPEHVGAPIVSMVERVKQWLADGHEVRIMTARVGGDDIIQNVHARQCIQDWCELHVGARLKVTCRKDYDMIELWDDRAVQVQENIGLPVAGTRSRV